MSVKNFNFLKPLSVANKIRLGKEKDGGYVVYKPSLKKVDALLTYGVGWDVDFEVDFFDLTQKKVFMHDHTMLPNENGVTGSLYGFDQESLRMHIDHIDEWKEYLEYLKKHGVVFYDEGISIRQEGKCNTLANHINKYGLHNSRVLLKMDIEGAEYPILDSYEFYDHTDIIDQIIVEIHDVKDRLSDIARIVEKLGSRYEIVHIHENNCANSFIFHTERGDISFPDVIELTLVKRDSIRPKDILVTETEYPIEGLDYPNDPDRSYLGKLAFDVK